MLEHTGSHLHHSMKTPRSFKNLTMGRSPHTCMSAKWSLPRLMPDSRCGLKLCWGCQHERLQAEMCTTGTCRNACHSLLLCVDANGASAVGAGCDRYQQKAHAGSEFKGRWYLQPLSRSSYRCVQAEKEAALIPEGMRMMSDDERLDTLAVLDTNRTEVEAELQKLPFFVETPSQVRLKNQLERRLTEIEEAKKIFSRPKVLVKA